MGTVFLGDYDSGTILFDNVEKTTDQFVPTEYRVLRSSKKSPLQATVGFDFAMLAATCAFLVTGTLFNTVAEIQTWSDDNPMCPVVKILTQCLAIVFNDFQFAKGKEILNSKGENGPPKTATTKSGSHSQEHSIPDYWG